MLEILEVFEEGKAVTTVRRDSKKVRKTTAAKTVKKTRKATVRKPFVPVEVVMMGMGVFEGKTKTGKVLGKAAGSFKVETTGKNGALVRNFDSKTGIMKTNNPFHVWKIDPKGVESKRKAKTA